MLRGIPTIVVVAVAAMALVTGFILLTTGNPPLGDCYGGVLSQDPLQCYALEQAERENLIDVTALYVAPGEGPLYVWLSQTEPVSDAVEAFLKTKSREFYDRWPELAPHLFAAFLEQSAGLPPTYAYEDIVLHVGGEKARRAQSGGASWQQVWPTSTTRDGVRSTSAFNVSDVNTTDFPEIDCQLEVLRNTCELWKEHPNLGLARLTGTPNTVDLHLKNVPEDEAESAALKTRLYPCHATIGRCVYLKDGVTTWQYREATFDVEFTPVNYDFGELWRWATILNRFAVSTGNTIGITGAEVNSNHTGFPKPVVYPLKELQASEAPSEDRTTIAVWALDPPGAVAALPALLPRLGIPADAVGVVAHSDRRRSYYSTDIGSDAIAPVVQPGAELGEGDGLPVGAIAGSAGLVAVVALGGVVAWRRRS